VKGKEHLVGARGVRFGTTALEFRKETAQQGRQVRCSTTP